MSSRSRILALAMTLALALATTPQPAAANGDIDAVMAQLAAIPAAERGAAFGKLTAAQQAGVLERVTLASVAIAKQTVPSRRPPGNASPSFSGCWSSHFVVVGYNIIGQPLWGHHGLTNWCDDGSTITSASGYGYGETYQIGWFYRGTTGYNAAGGVGFTYYERFDQSTFEACLTFCFQQANPWTRTHDNVGGSGWVDWNG